jgi:hypothetical protein
VGCNETFTKLEITDLERVARSYVETFSCTYFFGLGEQAVIRIVSTKVGGVFLLSAGILSATTAAQAEDPINKAIREEAPAVLKYVKDHGYHTVGVLVFTVKKGNQPPTLKTGTLNSMIARRLETALVLLNTKESGIQVIHDASRVASRQIRGATFKNTSGRRGLLNHSYPVWAGAQKHQADVFLTGEVAVEKDMKHLTIIITAFDSKTPDAIHEVLRIKNVPTNRDILAAIGQSFALPRGLRNRGSRDLDDAAAESASKGENQSTETSQDADNPVTLTISYDGKPVTLTADPSNHGDLHIRRTTADKPNESQKVKFVITNKSNDTVGVVLAVNGKNTLFEQDLTSKQVGECTKWILAPNESYTIDGFYMSVDGKDVRPFKVLSDDESAKVDISPEQKGVFSFFVFRPGSSSGMNVSTDGGDLAESADTKTDSTDLSEVQRGLRAATGTHAKNGRLLTETRRKRESHPRDVSKKGNRGLVVEGDATAGGNLKRIDAKLDPQPAISQFIRYYTGPTTPAQRPG